MRAAVFAGRNTKEMMRNPASLLCGIGVPVLLLAALSTMKRLIPAMADNFEISNMAPGMVVFSLSFLSTFLGVLMVSDKKQAFLMRLFTTPMTSMDYIIGYSLPVFPIALLQFAICFGAGFAFGLPVGVGTLVAILVMIPISALFVGFGLFIGSVLTSDNQVSGFVTLFINATIFLGGVTISLEYIGGIFERICYFLPFAHAVSALRCAVETEYESIPGHLLIVLIYTVLLFALSVYVFKKRMKE